MSESLFAAREAVYGALMNDAGVQALAGNPPRIYDVTPPDALFPHLSIGDVVVRDFDTKNSTGFEQILVLHVWSRARGRKETKNIMQAVYDCLHRASLVVNDANFVDCAFQSASVGAENDGITLHGVMKFRVVVQHRG